MLNHHVGIPYVSMSHSRMFCLARKLRPLQPLFESAHQSVVSRMVKWTGAIVWALRLDLVEVPANSKPCTHRRNNMTTSSLPLSRFWIFHLFGSHVKQELPSFGNGLEPSRRFVVDDNLHQDFSDSPKSKDGVRLRTMV